MLHLVLQKAKLNTSIIRNSYFCFLFLIEYQEQHAESKCGLVRAFQELKEGL